MENKPVSTERVEGHGEAQRGRGPGQGLGSVGRESGVSTAEYPQGWGGDPEGF